MATTFEKELRKIFADNTLLADTKFVGRCCYGRLTDTINAKVQFVTGAISNQYTALKITLLNRNEGQIDSTVLRLQDLWGIKKVNNPNFREGVSPHLWLDGNNLYWYAYQPTPADFAILENEMNSYLEVFAEPTQTMSMGMGQRMG